MARRSASHGQSKHNETSKKSSISSCIRGYFAGGTLSEIVSYRWLRYDIKNYRRVNEFNYRFKSRMETIQFLKADEILMTHS